MWLNYVYEEIRQVAEVSFENGEYQQEKDCRGFDVGVETP